MGARWRKWAEDRIRGLELKGAEAAVTRALGNICNDWIKDPVTRGKRPNDRCWPKKKTLAGEAGCHFKTVQRVTKALEARGWIDIIDTKQKDNASFSSNTYVLRTEQRIDEPAGPVQIELFGDRASLKGEGSDNALTTDNRLGDNVLPFAAPEPPPKPLLPRRRPLPPSERGAPTPEHDAPTYDRTLTGLDQSVNEEAFTDFLTWWQGIGGKGRESEIRGIWFSVDGETHAEEREHREHFERWFRDTGPEGGAWYTLPLVGKYLKAGRWDQAGPLPQAASTPDPVVLAPDLPYRVEWARLLALVGPVKYRSWLEGIEIRREGTRWLLVAASRFMRDRIRKDFDGPLDRVFGTDWRVIHEERGERAHDG